MKRILLSLLIAVTVGCTNNNDDDDNNNAASPTPTPPPADDGQGNDTPAAPVPDLVGTWTKPCVSNGSGYRRDTIVIDATTFEMRVYSDEEDSTCAGTADLEARANFTYTLPAAYDPAAPLTNADLALNGIFAKVNSPAAIAAANVASLCGFSDWQVGVERDVTGKQCIEDIPDRGRAFYQIFKLQAPNQLFVGKLDSTHTGENPAQRPTELETQPFTK